MGTPSDTDTATDVSLGDVEVTDEPTTPPAEPPVPTRPTPPPLPSTPPTRASNRSIPPPIPSENRRQRRNTLAHGTLEMPTAVDRAVADLAALDDKKRGERGERAVATVTTEPARALS